MIDFTERNAKLDETIRQSGLVIEDMANILENFKKAIKGRATTLSSDEFMSEYGRKM